MKPASSDLTKYASQHIDDLLSSLHTTHEGLTEHEALHRLKQYGDNTIVTKKKNFPLIRLFQQLTGPLQLILLFAAGLSFFLGQTIDATIIIIMVLMSGLMDFVQEYHAGKVAEKLQEKVATHTAVLRDKEEKEIKLSKVTVGDVIVLRSGDIIPADARLIETTDFYVNESTLTGESFPVRKMHTAQNDTDGTLPSLKNMVFSGSNVISGTGIAVVVATGQRTEFGKIASSLMSRGTDSEFAQGVHTLTMLLLKTTILFVTLIFLFDFFGKHDSFVEALTFSVAIAVGITPELLPVILSIGMAKGSLDMSKKGVIVKRLASIPNFGSIDILCTDKTGTLTEDHIEVVQYTDIQGKHSEDVFHHGFLNSYFQSGIKNPLDDAILSYKSLHHREYEKLDEIPFDFERKRMSVLLAHRGEHVLITKGAPEEVFAHATSVLVGTEEKRITEKIEEKMLTQYHALSEEGYRVIGVARKIFPKKITNVTKHDEETLTFLGFIAFFDPPKDGLKTVLQQLKSMHIDIKIITGDNELVTQKISRDVGFFVKGTLLGGDAIKLSDSDLKGRLKETTIFARFSPDQKERVIRLLREDGHVVGYMGDGVNDAPSLKTADVGISVNNAVDIAKESADIILTHKSLQELQDGVLEGRKILGNTMKYVQMGVSGNFGNTVSYLIATIFLPFIPMLPKQILLANFLYDISQVTIPSDSVDEEYIEQPHRWNIQFVRKYMVLFGLVSSLFDILTFYVLLTIVHAPQALFQSGWFVTSLATQILVIHVIRTRHVPFLDSIPKKPLLISTLLMVCIGWILPFTPLAKYFSLIPIPFHVLFMLAGVIVSYLLTVEVVKRIFYHHYQHYQLS